MYPECQLLPGPDVFYFMPPYHAIFTLAFWTIQNRKKYPEIIDIPDDSFISTIPSSLVVKLISINKIWNLVIGQGFYSANKIWLCKNSWNLNTKLQTWDTRGAARWKLGFWGIMMRNQSKSVTKKKFHQTPSSHDSSSPPPPVSVLWMWQKASGNILQCVWVYLSGCF